VLPFDASNPGSPGTGGLHQASNDGGSSHYWSQAGKEPVYLAQDGNLMSAEVSIAGSVFQRGTAHRLFKLPATGTGA
jgi:hypothetical protein